jgi:hypothetical protein
VRLPLSKWLTFAALMFTCTAVIGGTAGTQGQTGATLTTGPLPDFTFNLTRVPEDLARYSLVISDSDEHVISSAFSISQLETLKAVLLEAEKFALNEERVGANEPLTTRFQDNREQGFTVDVEKFRNQSRLFLTLTTDGSSQTAEAGRVNRTTRREVGFFFDLVSRLESMFPKQPPKSNK